MSFLLDTNVLSELRKGERCSPQVWKWRQRIALEDIFISAPTFGELRQGIENLRGRDAGGRRLLEKWLREMESVYPKRILPVTVEICDLWGRLSVKAPMPVIDGLLAATAMYHELTLVTRNIADVERSGVDCFNPFI